MTLFVQLGRPMRASSLTEGVGYSSGTNKPLIYGPKDGTYLVEFRTAGGDVLSISIARTETQVIRHFQERMPYGLFVPDVPTSL